MITFWYIVGAAGMILSAWTFYKEHWHGTHKLLPRSPLFLDTPSLLPPPTRHQPPDRDAEANEWNDWYFGYCPKCKQLHAQNKRLTARCYQ